MNEIGRVLPSGAGAPPAPPPAAEKPAAEPRETVVLGTPTPETPEVPKPQVSEPLAQAMQLATMHQQIPEEYLVAPFIARPADPFRDEARKLLPEGGSDRQIELTALTLFEHSLVNAPVHLAAEPVRGEKAPPGKGLAACGAYTGTLAASLMGGPATLTPVVARILEDFEPGQLWSDMHYAGTKDQFRTLGTMGEMRLANLVSSPTRELDNGIRLRGSWAPIEQANVEIALEELRGKVPQALELFHTIDVRTVLGENPDLATGQSTHGPAGLAGPYGELGLGRAYIRDLSMCKHILWHEVGHHLDRKMGHGDFYSASEASPFGKSENPADYVSAYARTFPWEDFAETHRDVIERWEPIHAYPDLMIHAQGNLGAKRAAILEGYERPAPPPSERAAEALRKLQSGDSPFGWKGENGEVIGAERDFRQTVQTVLGSWQPGQPIPGHLLMFEPEKTRWVLENFVGGEVVAEAEKARDAMLAQMSTQAGGLIGGMGYGAAPYLGNQTVLPQEQTLAGLRESVQALEALPGEFLARRAATTDEAARTVLDQAGMGMLWCSLQGQATSAERINEQLRIYLREPEPFLIESPEQMPELAAKLHAHTMARQPELMAAVNQLGPERTREITRIAEQFGVHHARLHMQLARGGPELLEALGPSPILERFRWPSAS